MFSSDSDILRSSQISEEIYCVRLECSCIELAHLFKFLRALPRSSKEILDISSVLPCLRFHPLVVPT